MTANGIVALCYRVTAGVEPQNVDIALPFECSGPGVKDGSGPREQVIRNASYGVIDLYYLILRFESRVRCAGFAMNPQRQK